MPQEDCIYKQAKLGVWLKVHLQWQQHCHFHFCLPFILENLPPKEQILSFKSKAHFEKSSSFKEANGNSQKFLSPFSELADIFYWRCIHTSLPPNHDTSPFNLQLI